MAEFTKEQLIEQAREKIKALKMSVTQSAFKDIRPELELDLALTEIALAALTAQEDNRIEYTRRVEAELITARARIALLEGLK